MKKYKLISITILPLVVSLSFCCCGVSEKENLGNTSVSSVSTENNEEYKWISDVEIVEKILLETPGTDEYLSNEEITKRFENIIQEAKDKKIDREICIHKIQNIISELHCTHISFHTKENDPLYKNCLGVYFQWFNGELRISKCTEQYKQYLGLKVNKISGSSINNVVDKYATIKCYETDTGKKAFLERYLYKTDLTYLGLMDKDSDGVEITGKDAEGKEVTFTAKLCEKNDITKLLQDNFPSTNSLPISYRNKSLNRNYCYEGDINNNSMYFLYTSCEEMKDISIEQCFGDMMNEINSNPKYKNLIIDVKWNKGGDRFLMQSLLNKYKDELKSKQIIIITGKDTYSAGFQLIADCLNNFENVKIYGEKTGQAVHHYTEGKATELSNLNCNLQVPTVKNEDPILVSKYGDIKDGITPDVTVYQTYEDYLNGVDTIYNKIIKDINN